MFGMSLNALYGSFAEFHRLVSKASRSSKNDVLVTQVIEVSFSLHPWFECYVCGDLFVRPFQVSTPHCNHTVCKKCIADIKTVCRSCEHEQIRLKEEKKLSLYLKGYTILCKLIRSSSFFHELASDSDEKKKFIKHVNDGYIYDFKNSPFTYNQTMHNSLIQQRRPSSSRYRVSIQGPQPSTSRCQVSIQRPQPSTSRCQVSIQQPQPSTSRCQASLFESSLRAYNQTRNEALLFYDGTRNEASASSLTASVPIVHEDFPLQRPRPSSLKRQASTKLFRKSKKCELGSKKNSKQQIAGKTGVKSECKTNKNSSIEVNINGMTKASTSEGCSSIIESPQSSCVKRKHLKSSRKSRKTGAGRCVTRSQYSSPKVVETSGLKNSYSICNATNEYSVPGAFYEDCPCDLNGVCPLDCFCPDCDYPHLRSAAYSDPVFDEHVAGEMNVLNSFEAEELGLQQNDFKYADWDSLSDMTESDDETTVSTSISESMFAIGNTADTISFGNPIAGTYFGNPVTSTSFGTLVASASFGNPAASTSYGSSITSTSFGTPVASIFGNPVASTSFGNPVASTSFANPVASTSYGNPVSSTSCGNSVASTSCGNSVASTSCGNSVTSTSFGTPVASSLKKYKFCICNATNEHYVPGSCYQKICPCYLNDRACSLDCYCHDCDNPHKSSATSTSFESPAV